MAGTESLGAAGVDWLERLAGEPAAKLTCERSGEIRVLTDAVEKVPKASPDLIPANPLAPAPPAAAA